MIWLLSVSYFESAILYLLLLFLSFKRHSKHFLMSCWNACLCPCKELQIPCVWMVIYKQNMLKDSRKVKGFQLEYMLPMTEMHSNTITTCKANWTDRTDQFCKELKRTIVKGRYRNNLISILQSFLLPKIKQINKYMKLTFFRQNYILIDKIFDFIPMWYPVIKCKCIYSSAVRKQNFHVLVFEY